MRPTMPPESIGRSLTEQNTDGGAMRPASDKRTRRNERHRLESGRGRRCDKIPRAAILIPAHTV